MHDKDILSREYTTPELAKILGVSTRKIISMLERGYFKPSIQDSSGHASRRLYNFDDLARAHITLELLNFGLSVELMRLMSGLLQNYLDEPFFMINKYGDICPTSTDPKTANKNKLDFLNNPTGGIKDNKNLPDSSAILYIPVKEMRAILEKRIAQMF